MDGNASDKAHLLAAVEALAEQLHAEEQNGEEASIFVADSGLYSAENVAHLAAVRWISRVPDTSKQATAALEVAEDAWRQDGDLYWAVAQAPHGERWVVVRTFAWIGRNRRMSKDYEFLPATSEAWISLSMIRLMLKRRAHEQLQPAFHYRRVA